MACQLFILVAVLSCSLAFVLCATDKKDDCRCRSGAGYQDPEDAFVTRVCGANGQSYLDPCWAKCKGTVPAYYGNCNDKVKLGTSCKKCTNTYDPVCGTDGVNYHNPCFSACAGVEIVSYGPCSLQKKPSTKCTCPKKGTASTEVCGTDGQTYGNECYAKCKGTTVKSKGRCTFPKVSCDCQSTSQGEDVCAVGPGFNNTIIVNDYRNLCFASCAKAKPVHKGLCLGVGMTVTNNWMRWTNMPHCGKDGKEYANRCQAECKNVGIKGMKFPDKACDE